MTRNVLRPMPPDFPEAYVLHGYDRIHEETYGASWQTVVHWIRQLPPEIKIARDEHLERTKWPNGRPGPNRSKNYVLGNRLGRGRTVDV